MDINQDVVKGKWRELKGEIQKAWGRLTDDELEATKGDITEIAGIIQKKYGESKDAYQKKISQILGRLKDHVKDTSMKKDQNYNN